jgi:hypothetical protein
LPPHDAFQGGDLGLVLLQQIGGSGLVESTGLVPCHPDPDQVAGKIVALRQPMQGLARLWVQNRRPWADGRELSLNRLMCAFHFRTTPKLGETCFPELMIPLLVGQTKPTTGRTARGEKQIRADSQLRNFKQMSQPHWQSSGCTDLSAAFLPFREILLDWHSSACRPAIGRP